MNNPLLVEANKASGRTRRKHSLQGGEQVGFPEFFIAIAIAAAVVVSTFMVLNAHHIR
jgi:hypothetical protein